MSRRVLALCSIVSLILVVGSCAPQSRRGGVRPDPPGPFDLVRSLWGDYSSLCPKQYDYCSARGRAICCPFDYGCCEDAGGAYCCSSRDRDWSERDDYDGRGRSSQSCSSDEITCSQGGRTTCCSSNHGCCAGADGPYCCPTAPARERDDDSY